MFAEYRVLAALCIVTQLSNGLLSTTATNESSHLPDDRISLTETRSGRCKLCARSKNREPQSMCALSFAGFPFYTLGRFQNTACIGSNRLLGTCVLGGECRAAGGIVTGSCSTITRQAVCCVCKCLRVRVRIESRGL